MWPVNKEPCMRDVTAAIVAFNQDRQARFLPYKYTLMASSPFRFYRGSCHLFYQDLVAAQTWQDPTRAWICGDLHVENFGTYRGRNRLVYFDLNDFDEAVLAPVTWEISRFIGSVYLLGHQLNINTAELTLIAFSLMESYLQAINMGKAFILERQHSSGILKTLMHAANTTNSRAFYQARIAPKSKRQPTLLTNDKKYFAIQPAAFKQELIAAFEQHLNQYADDLGQFKVCDAVIRVAGTGSIGLKRYMFLVYHHQQQQLLFFDIKQAKPSSLKPYLSLPQPTWVSEAERIHTIQHDCAYMLPAWYSSFQFQGDDYIVKETQPEENKMNFALCQGKPKKLWHACHDMVRLMAYAQLRSSARGLTNSSDELQAYANDHAAWQLHLIDYAHHYYHQVLQDYQHFCRDVPSLIDSIHADTTQTPKK